MNISNDYKLTYIPLKVMNKKIFNDYSCIEYQSNNKPVAIVEGRYLNWDSDILGVPCARIDSLWADSQKNMDKLNVALSNILLKMDNDGIRLCDIRIGMHSFDMIHIAEHNGFKLMDVLNIYLSKGESYQKNSNFNQNFRIMANPTLSEKQVIQAEKIAMKAFNYSRLYQDKNIAPHLCDFFYKSLFKNLLKDHNSEIGIALEKDESVAGFYIGFMETDIRLKGGFGYLWIIATASHHIGKRIGSQLLCTFLNTMHKTCSLIEIGTQINNYPANILYKSNNLSVVANVATFHRWNE